MKELKWPISLIVCGILLLMVGCGRGANSAQISLERGSKAAYDVRTAFFIKAWGLNRALITESRQKYIAQVSVDLLKNSKDGQINYEMAEAMIKTLGRDMGMDEAVTSENFAYLAYLLMSGERADQYLGQVDMYLESRRPIWEHLSKQARENTEDITDEIELWTPLISNLKKIWPQKK